MTIQYHKWWFAATVLLVLATACSDDMSRYTPARAITGFTRDSVDFNAITRGRFKLIDSKVKGELLMVKVLDSVHECYFWVYDLSKKKVKYLVKDPANDYIQSDFDVSGDSLVCLSGSRADTIYVVNLVSSKMDTVLMRYDKRTSPGNVLFENGLLYFLNDIYGATIVDLKSRKTIAFRNNNGSYTLSTQINTLSVPFRADINLLCGNSSPEYKLCFYGLTTTGETKWKIVIEDTWSGDWGEIHSVDQKFVLKDGKDLFAVNSESGQEVWRVASQEKISRTYGFKKNVLAVTTIADSSVRVNGGDFFLTLQMREKNKGELVWERKFRCVSRPYLSIFNDVCFIRDDKSFYALNLEQGSIAYQKLTNVDDSYEVETIQDPLSGNWVIRSYNDIFYW